MSPLVNQTEVQQEDSFVSILAQGPVRQRLIQMALPMLAGTFAFNAYGLTDAYFVSRLGTTSLAAMAFAIPVMMFLTFVAGGLGSGITTLMSHALGQNDRNTATRIVSHGFLLTLLTAFLLAIIGVFGSDWIFTKMGADSITLPLVRGYMHIWLIGMPFMSIPMMGNGLLIASGDSRSASRCMLVGPIINMMLNPLLINGLIGLPAMGIRGSALATVIAQFVSMVWMLRMLYQRHRLLKYGRGSLRGCYRTWWRILTFGIPGIASMILHPLAGSVLTWILADFGREAVAAAGAAGRIEMTAFIIPMALGISLTPFVSQNFGAKKVDRIKQAFRFATTFSLGYGALITTVFIVSAPWMAAVFSDDPKVIRILTSYIRITSIGYGMTEVHRYCTFFLTGLHRPHFSLVLDVLRVIILLIPLSLLGAHLWGIYGVFCGRLLSDILAGSTGIVWVIVIRRRIAQDMPKTSNYANRKQTVMITDVA